MKSVIEMAREARIGDSHGLIIRHELVNLERFAELIRADEREKWAKVCDAATASNAEVVNQCKAQNLLGPACVAQGAKAQSEQLAGVLRAAS